MPTAATVVCTSTLASIMNAVLCAWMTAQTQKGRRFLRSVAVRSIIALVSKRRLAAPLPAGSPRRLGPPLFSALFRALAVTCLADRRTPSAPRSVWGDTYRTSITVSYCSHSAFGPCPARVRSADGPHGSSSYKDNAPLGGARQNTVNNTMRAIRRNPASCQTFANIWAKDETGAEGMTLTFQGRSLVWTFRFGTLTLQVTPHWRERSMVSRPKPNETR